MAKAVTLKNSNDEEVYPVTDINLVNGELPTARIADSSITEAKIADDAVTTDKVADGAVTSDKIDWSTLDYTSSADAGRVKIGPLLVQWGRASIYVPSGAPGESGTLSITFPKAYSVAPTVSLQMEDIGGVCGEYAVVFGTTTSGFTGAIGHTLAADAGTRYYRWLAIGTTS